MRTLYEGLLDIDDIDKGVTQSIVGEWLRNNAKGNPKITITKKGTKITGDLILRNIDGSIPPLDLVQVKGNIYIENCSLDTLQGIFGHMCKVIGSLHITGCPNLRNLVGMPWSIEEELEVVDCRSFDSLEGAQALTGDVTIIKCKKRFKKSQLEQVFRCALNIYCSEEDFGMPLLEALSDPILIKLWDQIRNNKLGLKMQNLLDLGVRLDQITPGMRRTYKPDDKRLIKEVRRVLANNSNSSSGFALIESWDEGFTYIWVGRASITRTNLKPKSSGYGRRSDSGYSITDAISTFQNDASGAKCVHVFDVNAFGFAQNDKYQAHYDRVKAREGATATLDKEGLRQMLRDQQSRYRAAVAKLKAERKSDAYQAIVKKVENIMERFTKFMNKYIKDPAWANNVVGYKASGIFDSIRKGYVHGVNYQEYGVIYSFQSWSGYVVKVIGGDSSSYDQSQLESSKQTLLDAIDRADKRLSEVGL